MATKTLSVLGNEGAGKKTLIGSLIYKCGLELPQLEELERAGVRQYTEIVPFYEKMGRAQFFHAPSGPFVVDKSGTQDVALWVVDGADSASWALSAQNLSKSLSNGALQPRDKLIVAINKMDLVHWSEQVFADAMREFRGLSLHERTHFIPISGLRSENVVSTPQEPSWVGASGGKAGSVSGLMSLLG